ncbi:DUF1622 domain-containing protein [Sphingomicrobium sp. XHP0235]|uniref:DUF1622 domain-containing protein n=1 Tax=Sphingomicrobium aquimarinum TaxID=3133971 RepID=UPI0031FF2694
MHDLMRTIAGIIEACGVGIIVVGLIASTAMFLLRIRDKSARREAFENYRANLGRGILLGLEFLIAGDIIYTITSPLTLESVGLLAIVVLIRTFLSFSLETEIEGVLPWKRRYVNENDEQVR